MLLQTSHNNIKPEVIQKHITNPDRLKNIIDFSYQYNFCTALILRSTSIAVGAFR